VRTEACRGLDVTSRGNEPRSDRLSNLNNWRLKICQIWASFPGLHDCWPCRPRRPDE